MKKTLFIFLFIVVYSAPAVSARDFLVSFVEENYREIRKEFSYDPLIYHSIQVTTSAGPKVLVLEGSDLTYRKWLRQYLSHQQDFILKVEPSMTDRFIAAKVFKTDITAVHPFAPPAPKAPSVAGADLKTLKGNNFFLLVDSHETRSHLFEKVSQKMGYNAISFKTESEAMKLFMLQPEKFKLISINHNLENADDFVKKVLAVKHNIPIIIDPGYRSEAVAKKLTARYAGFKNVHIKPVVLKDLQKTIKNLINENA